MLESVVFIVKPCVAILLECWLLRLWLLARGTRAVSLVGTCTHPLAAKSEKSH